MLSANPVYTAPADLKFREAFSKVPNRIHLGMFVDETAVLSHWHVPEAHTWNLGRCARLRRHRHRWSSR